MAGGRPCDICRDAKKVRKAAEMVAAGISDPEIAKALGVSRMSAYRHRRSHILAPAKAIVAAAEKDAPAKEKRAQMLAAGEKGDPLAFLSLSALVEDLRRVHERLERTADAAEQNQLHLAVASVSSQQLRATELRAKMGSVGGFAPQAKGRDG